MATGDASVAVPSLDLALRQPVIGRILARLLDTYERSKSYQAPGPWKRAVIVRVETAFPELFWPDHGSFLEDFLLACEALSRAGAVVVVAARGYASNLPQELRLTHSVLPRAREIARAHGYQFLEDALGQLANTLTEIETAGPNGSQAEWMQEYIRTAREALTAVDLRPLGISAETAKTDCAEICDALRAAAAIAAGLSGWERTVSQRVFANTKRLERLRSRVALILKRADPQWHDGAPEDTSDVLSAYGVRRQPPTLMLAGDAALAFRGSQVRLGDLRPYATLPAEWSPAVVAGVAHAAPATLTTIENLQSFLAYIEERGEADGLAASREVVLFTSGFLAPVVLDVIVGIAQACPSVCLRHWGDADVGGLRIWRQLRSQLRRPVEFFRTTPEWVHAAADLGTALSATERSDLERLVTGLLADADLERAAGRSFADLMQAAAVARAVLASGKKVEQEGYEPPQ